MKVLTLALLLALPFPRSASPLRKPTDQVTRSARKGGRWYFSHAGHAVYCYGPVIYMNQLGGGFQRVATFCQGDKPVVPLKD